MILTDKFVSVNYDMNDYLPESSPSTVALDLMDEEFDGGVPNARVMVANVTIPEALAYKEQIEAVDGVTDVTWLDDAVSVNEPLEIQDQTQRSRIRSMTWSAHSPVVMRRYSRLFRTKIQISRPYSSS